MVDEEPKTLVRKELLARRAIRQFVTDGLPVYRLGDLSFQYQLRDDSVIRFRAPETGWVNCVSGSGTSVLNGLVTRGAIRQSTTDGLSVYRLGDLSVQYQPDHDQIISIYTSETGWVTCRDIYDRGFDESLLKKSEMEINDSREIGILE